jgi:hypothetical protein
MGDPACSVIANSVVHYCPDCAAREFGFISKRKLKKAD